MTHLLLAIIYLSFISLGLPDSLLGAAWPSMYPQFQVPVSYAGVISVIISLGTIFSSLQSDRLTRRFGTGRVTAVSVAMTALALLGFSLSGSFWMLCLMAIPYGLGAGGVDASLNNYVALHYASRHMSWLHCMWGVGTSIGPYFMALALTGGQGWNGGYRYIALIQIGLTLILFLSLPLWKSRPETVAGPGEQDRGPLPLREVLRIPGAKEVMLAFFCYCALESTAMLWGSSYLVLHDGLTAERAASFASLFCIGITLGRGISGFLTFRLSDTAMIRLGQGILLAGVCTLLLPFGETCSVVGLVLVGLGCAPIYPCIIHSTPAHFGADRSQAVIGVQMASAYVGSCLMPPVFGLLANHISANLFPFYLLALLLLMVFMHERLVRVGEKQK
ncbi:MAG: MFS transporter [Candidatus Onthomonas sp.]